MAKDDEILSWLRLINTDKVGPITFYKLLDKYGFAQDAIEALEQSRSVFSLEDAKKEFDKARSLGIEIILKKDERYPKALFGLIDAPPLIYVKGNVNLLNHNRSISIVGTRNATINGRKLTSRIAYDLTNNDVLVISGMAKGIDSSAHKGAMYALEQQGPTIAVLGTGVNVVYPKENMELYEQIAEQGVIVSEFPLGTVAQVSNFPRRNRIVSGLSDGLLVVEATTHSGSLITARQAREQGKLIFAIPGSPNEARATGPNFLLREGAKLVENAEDILKTLKLRDNIQKLPLLNSNGSKLFTKPLDISKKSVDISTIKNIQENGSVLNYLTSDGTDIDEIIRCSGLETATVSMQLIDLELEGKIIRLPGNKIALNGKKLKEKR